MRFIEEVSRGDHDDLLLDNLLEDRSPEGKLVRALSLYEEAESSTTLNDEDKGWSSNFDGSETISFGNEEFWRFSLFAYRLRGPWRNIVTNFSMLTGEPSIEFEREGDERQWNEIAEANGFDQYVLDMIKHSYMLNDHFTVLSRDEGRIPLIEMLLPGEIIKIDHKPKTMTPLKYHYKDRETELEPEDVVHHVLDRVGRESRGVSLVSIVVKELRYYLRWLEDFYNMGHLRARMPVVREVQRKSDVAAESLRLQKLPGVNRIVVENQGGKWNYPPVYQSVSGVREGYETFIQSIASGVNLPYFLVSGDYRNNSLASTLSANDPTVKLIRRNRVYLGADIKSIVRKATNDPKIEMKVTWPPVLDKDKKAEAEAYEIGVRNGAISSRTMSEDVFGKAWEGEDGEYSRVAVEVHNGSNLGKPDLGEGVANYNRIKKDAAVIRARVEADKRNGK